MSQPTAFRPRLRLTRRGRLVRSTLVLVLALLLAIALVSLVRSVGSDSASAEPAPSAATTPPESTDASSDPSAERADPEDSDSTPETEGDAFAEAEMVQTGTVGEGIWQFAPAVDTEAPEGTTIHTYAVRVEDGIGVGADEAAAEIARILADPRGWQDVDDVVFQQVGSAEDAEFTISLGSPPTVDQLCLPARVGGIWSCRIGGEVALNSDRWLHATPTYADLAEYRAYLVNHEVGHFLGHGHVDCTGDGDPAPVMLQQSMDLQGCVPNAWPVSAA